MSSFSDVRSATCRVVAADGSFRGTGFFVLPQGYVLTCHHVVFGLDELHVQLTTDPELHPAEYFAEFSDPRADIAVLRVPGLDPPPVQLGRMREGTEAIGYGFRPSTLAVEKAGHSFSGKLGPGQDLELVPPASMKAQTAKAGLGQERPWNQLPHEFRLGQVRNFHAHGLLERGISGGPIYDPDLRRVVGLFRAIEGEENAYVIPMDDVFAAWGDLEQTNRSDVVEPPLDTILVGHRLTLVREGARPIVPLASATFERLLKDYSRFGGRSREDEEFAAFLRERNRGYCFVTGLAGFGKTALLAHWAGMLSQTPDSPVFHFISPLVPGATDEASCLQGLCDQLSAIHGLGGDIPQDPRRLRPLYADLLRLSSPRNRIIVLLDGLDEALGEWTPDESLFPQELGEGVYVVFSARQIADRDWLKTLGLDANVVQTMELGKLTFNEITDVVVQTGLLTAAAETLPAIAERLLSLTDGDPFYLQDLIKDMEKTGANLDSLKDYEVGHINYLSSWWKTAARRHPGESFVDLMGTLAALRAPLGRKGLIRISDDDQLTGGNIDVLLEDAARYIQGNKDEGYLLKHSRIRQFIRETLDRDFVKYSQRAADFCIHWNRADASDQERLYILLHAVPHLIDADRSFDAIALLTPEWISEKWKRLGSYLSFIRDLDLLLKTVAEQSDDFASLTQFPALAVARETAREIMSNFPSELLTAWVRLGGIDHVADLLGALNEYRGQAAEPLIAVASELVSEEYLAEPTTNRVEALELASRLLERATAMLPLVRTSAWKLERLTEIARLARTVPFTIEQREPLIAGALSFADSQTDLSLRAYALGLMTQVLAVFPQHEVKARELVTVVKALSEQLELSGDQLSVRAMLLPALRVLAPDSLDEFVRSQLELMTLNLQGGSLGEQPVTHLLSGWDLQHEPPRDWLLALLEKLARLYIADLSRHRLPVALVRALCQVGQTEKTLQLMDEALAREPQNAVFEFFRVADVLAESVPECGDQWFTRAKQCLNDVLLENPGDPDDFPTKLAAAFGVFGRWDEGLAMLDGVLEPPVDTLIECILIAADTADPDASVLVARLVAKAEGLEKHDRAKVVATAARALARIDAAQARQYLERAIRDCLGELPEGDADQLRKLQALILIQHGDSDSAAAAAEKCQWQHRKTATLVAIIKTVSEPELLNRLSGAILTHVNAQNEPAFVGETVESVCGAASYLAPLDARLSASLCDGVHALIGRGFVTVPRMATLLRTRALFDLETAREQWITFSQGCATNLEPDQLRTFFEALESLVPVFADTIAEQLTRYRSLLDALDDADSRFGPEAAYVCALAAANGPEALTQAEALVSSLNSLVDPPAGAHSFLRLVEELMGSWAGELTKRPECVGRATRAVIAAMPADPARGAELLERIVDYSIEAEGVAVQAQSLAKFFSCLAQAPEELQGSLSETCDRAVNRALASLDETQAEELLIGVIEAFGAAGRFDKAEQLLSQIQGADARERAEELIQTAKANAQLDLSNPLDAAYLNIEQRGVALVFLREIRLAENVKVCLDYGFTFLADKDRVHTRSRLLSDFIPLLMIPFLELGGAGAASEVVAAIDDFDDRLVRAAALIAASA